MKTVVIRFTAVITAVILGIVFFLAMVYLGNKSKGPFEDILSGVDAGIARTENQMLNTRQRRSAALEWFNAYRNNKLYINTIDTLLLGAYDDATQESYENIIQLEDSLKTKLPVVSIYTAWGSKKDQVFPLLRAQALYDLGSIPMITWEPWLNDFDPLYFVHNNSGNADVNKGGLKAIAEGKYDAYIDKWAVDAKKFGMPFFLRWGHEMNDPYRYPWGEQNNLPEDYINAWRHVVNRFRAVGADNAIWIWSPHPAYATYAQFYPGHEFVDWIGFTGLNYGTVATWSQWWAFPDIINNAYNELSLYGKPIMVAEFGSLAVGGKRKTWFKEAFESIYSKYPAIKAVVFFHAANDNSISYKALDWSFKQDTAVLSALRPIIQKK
jgi:hypothetical protein